MPSVSAAHVTPLHPAAQCAVSNLKEAGLDEVVYLPDSQAFESRTKSYWSASSQQRPWAIVQPRTTDEVSKTVRALVGSPGCHFAIRSGGHMCWPGANNIESGITLDLGLMNETTYDPETTTASIQPGPRWAEVYAYLEKEGVMVAGGREGLVGVGGLLLGGGISFYSCRLGFACDNVINYEVVLADGSVVEANEKTNEDLYRALKGGGNNFGIVTRFDMKTFPANDVWDGTISHPKNETGGVIDALVHVTNHLNVAEDPAEHILVHWSHVPGAQDISVTSFLTQLDGVEEPVSLGKFTSIAGQKNLGTKTLTTKLTEYIFHSDKYDIWLSCNFKNDKRIAEKAVEVFEDFVHHVKTEHIPSGEFMALSCLQPLPASFGRHSLARGGNMLGFDHMPFDAAVNVLSFFEVETWELAQAILPKFKAGIEEIEAYAAELGGAIEWQYGNYCDGLSQDPFSTYGEKNIRKMKTTAKKYDPTGVFQTRVPGGYKISKLSTPGE